MSEGKEAPRKRSSFFFTVILIILILSVIALYQALNAYLSTPPMVSEGNYLIMLGIIGLGASAYLLLQTRRPPQLTLEPQKVHTTIQCEKCDFKKIRAFEQGDYIFKELEQCPKCDENMIITEIYREVKEEKH